jgi:type I restriction enzyme S subunit
MAKKRLEPAEVEKTPDDTPARWSIPAEWSWARVADVGNVKLGRQLATAKRKGTRSTSYIRAANITASGLDLSEVLRMDLTERERESYKLVQGDVLLGEASGSPSHVGKSALWADEVADCCFQNTVIRFRPHALFSGYALVVFRYFLTSGVFARTAHGVGIQHLGASRFAQLELPVPGTAEQQRIVEEVNRRLESVDAAAVSLESALRGIEEQVTTVMEAAATGDLGALGAGGGAGEVSGGRKHAETDLEPFGRFSIPSSWEWLTVGAVGETKNGKKREPRHETGANVVPYLRVANVLENSIDPTNLLSMNFSPQEQDLFKLRVGDILLNEGQSPELAGRPAMYRGEPENVCFQNHLIRFRASEAVNPEFALLVFRFYLRAGVFRAIARWSTNIATLGLKRFGELPFPLPPRPAQDELAKLALARLRELDERRATVESSRASLADMAKEIYAAAVRGELSERVEAEEPASAMLARLGPPPKEQTAPRTGGPAEVEDGQADERQDLTEVLRSQKGGQCSAEDLFAQAGYERDLTREVEGFYLELREALGKTIQPAGTEGGRSILKVAPDAVR